MQDRITQLSQTHEEALILDAEQMAPRVCLTTQQLLRLQRQGKVPCIKLGHRTLRFNVAEVMNALTKHTRRAA